MAVSDAALIRALGADTPGRAARAKEAAAVAVAMVQEHAPAAPSAIQDEAVLRLSGYLCQIVPGAARQSAEGPLQRTIHIPAGVDPLFASGAAALLSRYRARVAL